MTSKLFRMVAGTALLALFTQPAPAEDRHTLNTRVPAAATHLPMLATLPATDRLQLAVGLPLRDQDKLTNLLHQIYAAGNTNFHRYLTPAQFAKRFGPTDQDYQIVLDYVKSNHLEVVREYGNHALVDVAGSVSDIQKIFRVTLGVYQHPTEDRLFRAPDVAPTIDSGLPINFVGGLDNYYQPQSGMHHSAPPSPKVQAGYYTGYGTNFYNGSGQYGNYLSSDLRNAYVPRVPLKGEGQVVGLVEYSGYTIGDLTNYEALCGLPNVPLQNILLNGAPAGLCTNCGNIGSEAELDVEMAVAMAPNMDELLVVIDNYNQGDPDVDPLNELATLTNNVTGAPLANQISSSLTPSIGSDCIPSLMQMAAQGQTFFLCSFDAGAPTNGSQNSPTDENYLTEVGGTELAMNTNGPVPSWYGEAVWGPPFYGLGSTGYIETDLPIPDYQLTVNTTANGGSRIYRNVPDVAMCADNLELVVTYTSTNQPAQTNQISLGNGGTSAAAPLWAAFTALVNEQAAAQGKPTVGFINPALYAIAHGPYYTNCFHDITLGNNTNSASPFLFFAGPGYDNCTGLGSPNGPNLITALVGYVGPVFVNFGYTGSPQDGSYSAPFNTLAQGVNTVSNYGTIFILNGGASAPTPNLTKPMTITAQGGTAVIDN